MRLSKKVWLIAGIAVLAVVLGFLFSSYFQTAAEHEQMEDRLAQARSDLDRLKAQEPGLKNQESQAKSSLETSLAKFPQSVESIEYGEDLFRVAYGYDLRTMLAGLDLELTSLSASTPSDKKERAVTYSVSSFEVVVNGDVNNILSFIDAIGTRIDYRLPGWSFQVPWSVQMKAVNIEVARGKATINLDIYGYKR